MLAANQYRRCAAIRFHQRLHGEGVASLLPCQHCHGIPPKWDTPSGEDQPLRNAIGFLSGVTNGAPRFVIAEPCRNLLPAQQESQLRSASVCLGGALSTQTAERPKKRRKKKTPPYQMLCNGTAEHVLANTCQR